MCEDVEYVASLGVDDRQPVDAVVDEGADRVVERRVWSDADKRLHGGLEHVCDTT